MDRLSEKRRFTIEEASELGLGSVRQIRYMIKQGDIKCIPSWVEGGKRQKRWIPRSELARMGILPPLAEVGIKLDAAQVLKLKNMEKHLEEIYTLKKRLESELWLPPLNYFPARDLSVHFDTYNIEHTVKWNESEDGLPIIMLPVEDESHFIYLKQHAKDSEFLQHLPKWKQLGGLYIHNRSVLLNNIQEDIRTETKLPTAINDTTRGVFEGFSWVIFRNLFPQVRPDESKSKQLAEEAVYLAREGLWNEAIEANRNIIKMFPSDISALKRLGKSLMELQQYVSAGEAYSRALEIDPYDPVAQRILKELLQKHLDGSDIVGIGGGRYRVVSRKTDLWILAVFTDDEGENIASIYPTEIDLIITTFQNLLRKYRSSSEIETILEIRKKINQLERRLFKELKAVTFKTLANEKCDGCPV